MHVTVWLADGYRTGADGATTLDVEVTDQRADLGAVLDLLDARYPALGSVVRAEGGVRLGVDVYVDDVECRNLDGVATALTAGARIRITPSVPVGESTGEGA